MDDFLSFRRMITPTLIQIAFWVGLVGSVLFGLLLLFGQRSPSGLLVLFLGPLTVRLWCEMVMVVFRINETLTDISRSGQVASVNPTTYAAPSYAPPGPAIATSPQMPLSRIPDRPTKRHGTNDYW